MGKALYRQYRSTSFDEVIGQEHITTTLKNSLKSGSVAHAYLLTGPRGVGKTSVARILAYEVNDLPYNADGNHLDIIEIDAASNRRIDEIRSLRERVQIAPTSAKYKVYIIDEVHMLTREAFNALLKTLEEPPAHVIFILATTDIHKLPDTIISRCITFTFRPIDSDAVVIHLSYIAKKEKLDVSKDALNLLAIHGEGSFRDSISLLDQIKDISSGKIEKKDIELALGLAPEDIIGKILRSVADSDPKGLNTNIEEAYRFGASENNIAKQIGEEIRGQIMTGQLAFDALDATALLKDLLDVASSSKPRATLELALLGLMFKTTKPISKPQPAVENTAEPEIIPEQAADEPPQEPVEVTVETVPPSADENDENEIWTDTLDKLKKKNNTLYGIARMAQADQTNKKLKLSFKFPFHFKQISQPKNRAVIDAVLEELGHKDLVLEIIMSADDGKSIKPAAKKDAKKDDLETITNIFGDSEVLES